MPIKDLIQNKLTDADRTEIDKCLTMLESLLAEKLVGLSPEDRQKYGSISEQNKLFVNKIKDYAENLPAHNPTEIDWAEFMEDYKARQFLETRANKLSNLLQQMTSTKILHDYDNYQDSLAYYSYIEYRANRNVPGASEIYSDLKQFFPRSKSTSAGDTTEGGNA